MYFSLLCHSDELYLEDQGRAAGNAWLAVLAISFLGRDIDLPSVAGLHLLQGGYPAFDQILKAEGRCHAAEAAVKRLPVYGPVSNTHLRANETLMNIV